MLKTKFILIIFLLTGVYCFAQIPLQHQSKSDSLKHHYRIPNQHILKSNPFVTIISQNPLTGELRLMYETPTSPYTSIYLGASYLFPNIITLQFFSEYKESTGVDLRMGGFRGQLGYKFYLNQNRFAPRGIYIGPHLSYSVSKINPRGQPDYYVKMYFMNASAVFGWQFFLGQRFSVDIYSGFGYRYNYLSHYNRFDGHGTDLMVDGLKFALGINFGFSLD